MIKLQHYLEIKDMMHMIISLAWVN
jgi:hypothetical protein